MSSNGSSSQSSSTQLWSRACLISLRKPRTICSRVFQNWELGWRGAMGYKGTSGTVEVGSGRRGD